MDVGWHSALHQVVEQVTQAQYVLQGDVGLNGIKPITPYYRTQISGVYHLFVLQSLSQCFLKQFMEISRTEHHDQWQKTTVERGWNEAAECLAYLVVVNLFYADILKSRTDILPQHLLHR